MKTISWPMFYIRLARIRVRISTKYKKNKVKSTFFLYNATVVVLFSTFGVDTEITNLNLVFHFFRFYTIQGIDEFFIILQTNNQNLERIQQTKNILRTFNIQEKLIWQNEYSSNRVYSYMVQAIHSLEKNDWIIFADIDEFHDFPKPANLFLMECEEKGQNCVKGNLVDRVAENGELKFIEKNVRIDQQFPHAAVLTEKIAQGSTRKVVALKKPLIPGRGHHDIIRKKRKARCCEFRLDVHHFKWDSLVTQRLKRRHHTYKKHRIRWHKESERLYRYFQQNDRVQPEEISERGTGPIRGITGYS